MPQTRVDRKFFLVRVDQILLGIASIIVEKLLNTGLQEFKGILKNITGGEE